MSSSYGASLVRTRRPAGTYPNDTNLLTFSFFAIFCDFSYFTLPVDNIAILYAYRSIPLVETNRLVYLLSNFKVNFGKFSLNFVVKM